MKVNIQKLYFRFRTRGLFTPFRRSDLTLQCGINMQYFTHFPIGLHLWIYINIFHRTMRIQNRVIVVLEGPCYMDIFQL